MNKNRLLPARLIASLASVALLATTTQASQIRNISARSNAAGLHAGFVIDGSQTKTVLIRVLGPALADPKFRVAGAIPDPQAILYRGNTLLADNDNWVSSDANKIAAMNAGAFAIAADSKDAMIVAELPPGTYTVMGLPSARDPRPGICLVEVYDLSHARGQNPGSRLINASIRMIGTGTGDDTAIVGVVFVGDGVQEVLVRAAGPSLTQFGVQNVMANPSMLVYGLEQVPQTTPPTQARTIVLKQNDNWWQGEPVATSMFDRTGAFPFLANSADAALVMPVGGGTKSYTIHVGGTGAFVLEIYAVR